MPDFVFVHLSDLHFCSAAPVLPSRQHSLAHLRRLEELLSNVAYDRVIVSGDISDRGDEESLELAKAWLTSKVKIGEHETGLAIPADKLAVVPGNHDAWNGRRIGPFPDIRQTSLENFHRVFAQHRFTEGGLRWEMVQKGSDAVFLAYVDSCYLGDGSTAGNLFSLFGKIAKGRVSVAQSQQLLQWYDQGLHGELADGDGVTVAPAVFARAIKLLVIHHFLFEPTRAGTSPLMGINAARTVFRNMALADFDAMLCGHSHVRDIYRTTYGEQFDRRARARYMLNHFRRQVGLDSLPLQLSLRDGQRLSRRATLVVEIASLWARCSDPSAASLTSSLADTIRALAADPRLVREQVATLLHESRDIGDIIASDLNEITPIIAAFSAAERQQLEDAASELLVIANSLNRRPFVQYMNGSSCKTETDAPKKRSFYIHELTKLSEGWRITTKAYAWDDASDRFGPPTMHDNHFHAA